MAWHVVVTDRPPYSDLGVEMKDNAEMIASYMTNVYHWSLMAVCGLLGNISIESFLNAGQYEFGSGTPTDPWGWGYGVGLMQWTRPSSTITPNPNPNPWLWYAQHNNIDPYDPVKQCEMINGCDDDAYTRMPNIHGVMDSMWGWINSSTYPVHSTFDDFKTYTGDDIDMETDRWFYCAEWHNPVEDGSLSARRERARYWWDYFGGHPIPPPVPPTPTQRKGMPVWMMLRFY